MTFTVTFVFDGLFVFVPRRTGPTQALYVLMANSQGHGPLHEGYVSIDSDRRPFSGELDLSNSATSGLVAGGGPPIPGLLPLGQTTGKKVPNTLFTDPIGPASPLAGRVILPLHREAEVADQYEQVAIAYEKSPGSWVNVNVPPKVTGRIRLKYDATAPVTIGQFPPISVDTEVKFGHLPNITPAPAGHLYKSETPLGHFHMNHRIFGTLPKYRTAEPYIVRYSADFIETRGSLGVDPVLCTAGGGCAEGEPNPPCSEG